MRRRAGESERRTAAILFRQLDDPAVDRVDRRAGRFDRGRDSRAYEVQSLFRAPAVQFNSFAAVPAPAWQAPAQHVAVEFAVPQRDDLERVAADGVATDEDVRLVLALIREVAIDGSRVGDRLGRRNGIGGQEGEERTQHERGGEHVRIPGRQGVRTDGELFMIIGRRTESRGHDRCWRRKSASASMAGLRAPLASNSPPCAKSCGYSSRSWFQITLCTACLPTRNGT